MSARLAVALMLGVAALVLGVAALTAATAPARAGAVAGAGAGAATPCRAYPRPGTAVPGPAPAALRAQYGVLRRAQRPGDRIALRRLGSLPESQILTSSIRHLGAIAHRGNVYLVASRHLLPSPLEPPRCVPAAQRALQQALLPSLAREYAHHGLCLVIVYRTRSAPTCGPAPGTIAPFLSGAGVPGFGLAPDGVPAVLLRFRANTHPPIRAAVHGNFWSVVDAGLRISPCGLDWIDRRAVVLRTVTSCVTDTS